MLNKNAVSFKNSNRLLCTSTHLIVRWVVDAVMDGEKDFPVTGTDSEQNAIQLAKEINEFGMEWENNEENCCKSCS